MFHLLQYDLEKLLEDDMPYFDLTTHVCGIENQPGVLRYITREATTLACVEDAKKLFEMLGAQATLYHHSGEQVQEGTLFLEIEANGAILHQGWRAALNLLEHASGIATKTAKFIQKAKKVNKNIVIATTRKNFPGLKKMSIKAVVSGGALPHRLGLSETILIFDEHISFMGGMEVFLKKFQEIKDSSAEKKVVVEAHNEKNALLLAGHGVDVLQLDKFKPELLQTLVPQLRELNPRITVIAAGGINMTNVEVYAGCGVDVIATSSLFFTQPADIKAQLLPL